MERVTDSGVAGSDAERRAAVALKRQIGAFGSDAEVRPFLMRPRFGPAHALHCVVAIAGSVLTGASAIAGAIVVGVALLSAFLDVIGTAHLGRRLTGRRASQNVELREGEDKPGVLVLVAGYDAVRDSRAFALTQRALRDPWLVMLVAMLAVLVCCVARAAGVDSQPVVIAQFIPTVALILLTPALLDLDLQPATNDPPAAAMDAVDLAGELDLQHFGVWLVLAGATHPFGLGMRAWLRANRKQLDRESTAVIELADTGLPDTHYARRAGAVLPGRCHRDLVRLAREVAEDSDEEIGPEVSRTPGNAAAAIARGLPSIRLSGDGAADLAAELARRLDAELGPRLRPE